MSSSEVATKYLGRDVSARFDTKASHLLFEDEFWNSASDLGMARWKIK